MTHKPDKRAEALNTTRQIALFYLGCALAGLLLLLLACLPAARAQLAESAEIAAGVEQAIARLQLSEEQSAQLRPVFDSYLDEQIAVLEEYGALAGAGDSGQRSNIENAQEMVKRLNGNSQRFEGRVAQVLSEAQMSELRRLQEESREAFRERAFAAYMKRIGDALQLTGEQLTAVAPVLAGHQETQLEIFEKHEIDIGGEDKPGFGTLLALRRDANAANARTLKLLSDILSKEQLASYKKIENEQRRKVQARIR